jgi:hypothetical protein
MALVTAIRGVWSECDTPQITWKPTKHAEREDDEVLHEGGGGVEADQRQDRRARDEQADLAPRLALDARRIGRAPLLGGEVAGLGDGGLRRRGDGLDLGRRRGPGDGAGVDHGGAADHVVLHVLHDRAVLPGVRSDSMWRTLLA